MQPSVVGPDSENTGRLHRIPPQWMGQECSGPFLLLRFLTITLLVVGRQKDKRVLKLILLQRVPSG